MKRSIYTGLIAIAAAISGCSADDLIESAESSPVSFSASVDSDSWQSPASSRAAAITDDNLGSVGVFAFCTGQNDWAQWADKSTPNFMINQKVTRAQGSNPAAWSYSPPRYWPADKSQKFSFFAYAPYKENTTWSEDGMKVHYSLVDDYDLIYAVPDDPADHDHKTIDITHGAYGGVVPVRFRHALAKIGVEVAIDPDVAMDGATTISVQKILFTGNTDDNQLYFSGNLNIFTGQWSELATNDTYHVHSLGGSEMDRAVADNVTTTYQPLNLPDKYILEIPADFPDNSLSVSAHYTITTVDTKLDTGKVVTDTGNMANISINFEAGKAYTFRILIGLQSIKVEATESDWEELPDIPVQF